MKESVVIICGGGPAPGINTVISSVSKVFLDEGYRVIGLHQAFKGLFEANPKFEEITFDFADKIYSRGGSTIQMSRHKPKDSEFTTNFFTQHNVKLLVTIGGDDTASTANRISKFLNENNVQVANIHVPKTIDNDLPLPEGVPTFGYHSAKDEGVRIGTTVYEDARTSASWFVLSAMGREAGHLAFGLGTACHFPMIIIPEMFNKAETTLKKITNLIISSMLKRKLIGVNYGVAVISEGVFHSMSDEEIETSGINFTYDDHGHPELGNVSKSHIFNMLVQRKLKRLGIDIKSRPVELGYELRCCRPIAYDLTYCSLLGIGVRKLFKEGYTGCMVTVNTKGEVSPLFLKDVEDEKGKVRPRLVNIDSERAQLVYNGNLHYIKQDDYETLSKTYPGINPEEFDFRKILNW